MLDISIANGRGRRNKASVSNDGFLRVDTKPYYEYKNAVRYFVSDEYGRNMNVNASPSASITENVYDGGDNVYWTASSVNGTPDDFVLSSPDQNHTDGGSLSFHYALPEDGDIAQFAKGSNLDLTSYNALTGWIYLTDWDQTGTKNILFYGYDTVTGTIVGNSVGLSNYINTSDLNTWQPFTITLNALGLVNTTIDSIRTQAVDIGIGNAPRGYLDDLKLTGSILSDRPSPVRYRLEPNTGEYLIVESLNFVLVREYNPTITNSNMYGLSHDDILGFIPDNGILYRRYSEEELEFNVLLKTLFDLISIPDMTITDAWYDGTNTLIKIRYPFVEQAILKYSLRDYIELRISDNFSSFSQFRVSAGCKIRNESYVQPAMNEVDIEIGGFE